MAFLYISFICYFEKQCQLCPVNNCKYCFEYQSIDLSKCTLCKHFEIFEEEEIKVGRALQEKNFVFNFNTGKCIYQKSLISNCLRSFNNLDGLEVCTLSQIDDFDIAPQIVSCQKYLNYCLQCLLSPESILKCVFVRKDIQVQQEMDNSKIVIESDVQLSDGWIQTIYSFIMQFLPNKYYYHKSDQDQNIMGLIVECNSRYKEVYHQQCEKKVAISNANNVQSVQMKHIVLNAI